MRDSPRSPQTNRKRPAERQKGQNHDQETKEVNPRIEVITFNISRLKPKLQLTHQLSKNALVYMAKIGMPCPESDLHGV